MKQVGNLWGVLPSFISNGERAAYTMATRVRAQERTVYVAGHSRKLSRNLHFVLAPSNGTLSTSPPRGRGESFAASDFSSNVTCSQEWTNFSSSLLIQRSETPIEHLPLLSSPREFPSLPTPFDSLRIEIRHRCDVANPRLYIIDLEQDGRFSFFFFFSATNETKRSRRLERTKEESRDLKKEFTLPIRFGRVFSLRDRRRVIYRLCREVVGKGEKAEGKKREEKPASSLPLQLRNNYAGRTRAWNPHGSSFFPSFFLPFFFQAFN